MGVSHISQMEDDIRRASIIRNEIGYDIKLMMDANQIWDVDEAINYIKQLAQFQPWWIEEPTNPDDIIGHKIIAEAVQPIKVATGEVCQNRVIFKQFITSGAIDICPHAGGVGLCEYVQHIAMIDFVCVSGTMEDRVIEYTDHLHEHFLDPVIIKDGAYMPPTNPGYSVQMKTESLSNYTFPDGEFWK